MGSDNGLTYGEPKAHVSFAVTALGFAVLECAVKQGVQFLWGNSLSVIGYRKAGIISPCTERQLESGGEISVQPPPEPPRQLLGPW